MTISNSFSAVEWGILCELPQRIVASAVTVDPLSGIGALLEEVAGLTQLSQGAKERPESELVQAVFAEYKDEGEGEAQTLELSRLGIENFVPETLQMAVQVGEMLPERVDSFEASAYFSWLRETAESVCVAARSGGILGIGGKRISDLESEFLDALDAAFAPAQPAAE